MPQRQMLLIHSTTLSRIRHNVYLQFSFRSRENRTSVQYARSHLAASHVHSSLCKPTLHIWPDIISRLLTLWRHHFLRIQRRYFNERNDCEINSTRHRLQIPCTLEKTHHITASNVTAHRLNIFGFKDFKHYPFLIYIYITYINLTEIIIMF